MKGVSSLFLENFLEGLIRVRNEPQNDAAYSAFLEGSKAFSEISAPEELLGKKVPLMEGLLLVRLFPQLCLVCDAPRAHGERAAWQTAIYYVDEDEVGEDFGFHFSSRTSVEVYPMEILEAEYTIHERE